MYNIDDVDAYTTWDSLSYEQQGRVVERYVQALQEGDQAGMLRYGPVINTGVYPVLQRGYMTGVAINALSLSNPYSLPTTFISDPYGMLEAPIYGNTAWYAPSRFNGYEIIIEGATLTLPAGN